MKIGDILLNEWASENNPLRKTIIINITPTQVIGLYIYKSKFKKANFNRKVVESDSEHKFKVIGHTDIIKLIKNEIQNCKEEA